MSGVVAALRVMESHARTYRHTWKGSVVSTFLSPVLFLLAMGLGLGSLVDRGSGPAGLQGLSYLEFFAPGLLAATIMQTAAGDSSWPVMLGMKWQKTYHAALATPLRPRDLVVGNVAWTAVRLLLTATIFVAVMVAFGVTGPVAAAAAVPPAVLTGLAFGSPIMAFTARLENDYAIAALFRFGIVPMFLFSGTFFPISQLPQVIQPLALVVPLWHGAELCRAAAVGVATALPPVVHVAYLTLWIGLGTVVAVRVFNRRLVR